MSIKSDKWIRRMAQEHGMIEPFVERQIRGQGDAPVISYGVSSYGYDVRCADEFKVFTNINSATVDPNLRKAPSDHWQVAESGVRWRHCAARDTENL